MDYLAICAYGRVSAKLEKIGMNSHHYDRQ